MQRYVQFLNMYESIYLSNNGQYENEKLQLNSAGRKKNIEEKDECTMKDLNIDVWN